MSSVWALTPSRCVADRMARRLITCNGCGAINNVPDGKPGRPVCGRCGANLPETEPPKVPDLNSGSRLPGFLIAGIVILAVLAYAGAFDSSQSNPQTIVSEQSPAVSAPQVASELVSAEPVFSEPPVSISTGLVMPPSSQASAPLVLNANHGANFYVKLTSLSGEDVMSFYVAAGESFKTNVPLGDYEIKYAAGQTWYGTKFLFGPDTIRKRMRKRGEVSWLFKFARKPEGYSGYEFELKLVRDGKLATENISEDEF